MARVFRTSRSYRVIFWVFAVPIAAVVVVAVANYPAVGIPVAVVSAAFLALQVRWNRYEARRLAAREPDRPDSELFEAWRAVRTEPGRMPEEHGPGDPDATLVVDAATPDPADLGDLTR